MGDIAKHQHRDSIPQHAGRAVREAAGAVGPSPGGSDAEVTQSATNKSAVLDVWWVNINIVPGFANAAEEAAHMVPTPEKQSAGTAHGHGARAEGEPDLAARKEALFTIPKAEVAGILSMSDLPTTRLQWAA